VLVKSRSAKVWDAGVLTGKKREKSAGQRVIYGEYKMRDVIATTLSTCAEYSGS